MQTVGVPEVVDTTTTPPPPRTPWRSIVGLGHASAALVVASVSATAAAVVSTIVAASRIDEAEGSSAISAFGDAMQAVGVHAQVQLLHLVLVIGTGITLITWLYRAVQNDRALGRT